MTQKEIETPAAAESPNKPAASQAAPAAKTPDPVKTNGRKPATIGPSIVIHGDVSGEEDLIVDGTVEGTVNFKDNNLVVSANGQVKANISARIIRIDGEVKGELHGSEQVVISPSGKVHGDIRAPRVVLRMAAHSGDLLKWRLKNRLQWTAQRPQGYALLPHDRCALDERVRLG